MCWDLNPHFRPKNLRHPSTNVASIDGEQVDTDSSNQSNVFDSEEQIIKDASQQCISQSFILRSDSGAMGKGRKGNLIEKLMLQRSTHK